MGRLLLLLVLAAGATLALRTDRGADRSHGRDQNRTVLRQALDDAAGTVLDAAADPTRYRWAATRPTERQFRIDGTLVTVEDYATEANGTVLRLRMLATRGGLGQRRTSRYRIPGVGWPGPLWVDAPYAVAQADPSATIRSGGRPVYFDATRFNDFRLGTILSLTTLATDFGTPLGRTAGDPPALSTVESMDDIRVQYGVPRPVELAGMALGQMRAGDAELAGGTVVSTTLTYGNWANPTAADARIVHVDGPLTVAAGGKLRGTGLLFVEGDLTVIGELRWSGLVLVQTPAQRVAVDFSAGHVEIRGGIVVDQEGPPPGGHTDLTINRDLTGRWSGANALLGAIGETGPGTPGDGEFGGMARAVGLPGLFYDHEHRFESRTPERRTIYFAERGASPDRHERFTWFRRTLTDIAAAQPGERVYVRFAHASEHGAARYTLVANDTTYSGTVAAGFGSSGRSDDPFASPSFRPADLSKFVVDVQSLRMLRHLTDNQRPESPFWPYGPTACPSRPLCIGYLADRDGALVVQIVRARDDRPLYEASVYWHTQAPGSMEYLQELAADDAWRTAIRSGAEYGTLLKLGRQTTLRFDEDYVSGITGRLGFGAPRIEHLGSDVEYVNA